MQKISEKYDNRLLMHPESRFFIYIYMLTFDYIASDISYFINKETILDTFKVLPTLSFSLLSRGNLSRI